MSQLVDNNGASIITGLKVSTLSVMRSTGTGPPSFKRNGRVVYRLADLEQWMADREATSLRGVNA